MRLERLDPRYWLSVPGLLLGLLFGLLLSILVPATFFGAPPAGYRNARQAEGEQMLGSIKGQARVSFAKSGQPPRTLTGGIAQGGSGVEFAVLAGKHYRVLDVVGWHGPKHAVLFAIPVSRTGPDPIITVHFAWQGGDGKFTYAGEND